ncbi:MAG TPA: phosphoglycerate dehydrogenase [Desulfobacterales bacterium]|nr:phosphoglycerate dehydrogenase [Desulfobacterales bacterium]
MDLRACCVLVTPTTFGMQDPALRSELEQTVGDVRYSPEKRPLTASELTSLVNGIDGWIAGLDEIDASVIAAADRLKVIARYGVGFDRVDVAAATQRGIVVTNTPGANSAAVAELTIGLMLALARRVCQANQAVRSGQWPRISGVGLAGKTVGLVGFGSIGQEVARRLSSFGCRVLVADPYVSPKEVSAGGAIRMSLDELLPVSDFVCLHAAATPVTTGMVNESFLRTMKPGAFLVNTARGELIEEAALAQAIESGRLRGAALDCLRKEPPGIDHPLLQLPQVMVTPHSGAHTDEAVNAMGRMALDACLAVLRGERPAHVINPAVYTGRDGV